MPWTANLDDRTVRMGRYKYIRWTHERDAAEFHDLDRDPLEERNLIARPGLESMGLDWPPRQAQPNCPPPGQPRNRPEPVECARLSR